MIPTPKRSRSANSATRRWYDYYAGYSSEFVTAMLGALNPKKGALVLDPWNGAGTTTEAASSSGYSSRGHDLNPAMVVVARGRTFTSTVEGVLNKLAHGILADSRQLEHILPDDPLLAWMYPASAEAFRGIQAALLADANCTKQTASQFVDKIEPKHASLLVALFRTLRSILSPFRGTNPTWLRPASTPQARIRPSRSTIHSAWKSQVRIMAKEATARVGVRPVPKISVSNSTNLPEADGSAGVVITSPPYCTRIDYAIATRAELALLGLTPSNGLRDLRSEMIGTPTIGALRSKPSPSWGKACCRFLRAVRCHDSKASATYYYTTHIQYYDRLFRSFVEIDRVLQNDGDCVLVIQDSYYKELHNDLPTIVSEMASQLGWRLHDRIDYPVKHLLTKINPRSLKYQATRAAYESVLWFKT